MKKLFGLGMAFLLSLGLAGCGSTGTDTKKNEEEKKLVLYAPSPAGLVDKLAAGFEEKTGIKVEVFQGTTGEITARLEAEKQNPVADVVIMASWSDGMAMKEKGELLSYTPENAEKLYEGWQDSDHMLFGTSASAVGVLYNTKEIASLSADWKELGENAAYQGKLAIPDPIKSGSAKDFLAGFINKFGDDGWTILDNLTKNGMTCPGANKQALEAVTTGETPILVAGVDYNAYESKAKGEPIDIYYPASGTIINPRPAMIMKTSKHQENAKQFMDYLLSDDAQKLVTNAYLLPGRSDITTDKRTNVKDIPALDVDWNWMMENSDNIAQKVYDSTKK